MLNEIWVEKYRPKKIDDCILPAKTKRLLNRYANEPTLPNLLFAGPVGIGKTTAARALMEQTETDHITINASLEGNVDTIRTRVIQFASTVSFSGKRKFVVFEEVDKMTVAAQTALRAFIEEFTGNCGYIFTGNQVNQLDPAIRSRLTPVDFVFDKEEKPKLAKYAFDMITRILKKEKIEFEEKDVQHLLINYLKKSTDLRQLLIIVQRDSKEGKFVLDLQATTARLLELVPILKSKKIKDIRTWAGENADLSGDVVFGFLYDNIDSIVKGDSGSVAAMIAHIAEHQFQHSFVSIPEINIAALLIDIASECV